MARAASWYALLIDAERAVHSDDGGFGLAARRLADTVLAESRNDPEIKALCPDPGLFGLFLATLAVWSARNDGVGRERVSGPLISLISALGRLPNEAERKRAENAQLSPIERAIPHHDR